MDERKCDPTQEEQFEDQFDGKENRLVGRLFIEVRGGEILSAGYVIYKFDKMDLYSLSPVDLDTLEELGWETLIPIEALVVKNFRFYDGECNDLWEKDVKKLVEEKKEKQRLADEAKKTKEVK